LTIVVCVLFFFADRLLVDFARNKNSEWCRCTSLCRSWNILLWLWCQVVERTDRVVAISHANKLKIMS